MAKQTGSKETYMVVNQPLPNAAEGRPKRRFLQLRGIDDPKIAGVVHEVTIGEGGAWFSEAAVREGKTPGETLVELRGRRRAGAADGSGRLGPGESWQDHSGSRRHVLAQRSHLDHRGSDEVRWLTV